MKGWKGKLTILLIVYFAGFATAIYMLAPVAGQESDEESGVAGRIRQFDISSLKSEEFNGKFNCRMKKCMTKVKDVTGDLTVYLKGKFSKDEADKQTDS